MILFSAPTNQSVEMAKSCFHLILIVHQIAEDDWPSFQHQIPSLKRTASLPLKIGRANAPKGNEKVFQSSMASGVTSLLVSGSVDLVGLQ